MLITQEMLRRAATMFLLHEVPLQEIDDQLRQAVIEYRKGRMHETHAVNYLEETQQDRLQQWVEGSMEINKKML